MADKVSLLGKRKRAQVSYAEGNEELDRLLFNDELASDEEEDDGDIAMVDDDAEYGKKVSRKHIAARKQAKRAKHDAAIKKKLAEKPFPFMRLPLELRYMIYGFALSDDAVRLRHKTKSYRRSVTRWPICSSPVKYDAAGIEIEKMPEKTPNEFAPSLLAASKQIHAEAVSFLYDQPFVFEDFYALHSFLAEIGPRNCAVLSDITVKAWRNGRGVHKAMTFCAFIMLKSCTNLRSLFLDCDIGWSWNLNPKGLARTLYRNGHHFFEAFGIAKGRCDAVMDIINLKETNFGNRAYSRYGMHCVEEKQFKQKYSAELRRLLGA